MITFLAALVLAETPQKTVQAFIDAYNAQDFPTLSRQIVGGKTALFPPEFRQMPKLKATLGETKIDGDSATVEADVELSGEASLENQKSHETVQLRLADGNWAIVPVNPETANMREPRYIALLAYVVTNPEIMASARKAAKKTVCLSNVKQLALGTMMYANDYDDVLPKASFWKSSIMPYVRNEAIFHCPEDTSGAVSYFLEPRLSGKSLATPPSPAETAMIVEGTPKKTAFRHGGMASLGYLDGHAKIVKPDAMLKARTKPLK